MNKGDIRTRVRAITELEVEDVSDETLDMFILDGYDRMISIERRWPFFEVSATLTTIANTRDYLLTSIGTGNIREISSIVNSESSGRRLSIISYDDGEGMFLTGSDYAAPPAWFSLWAGDVQIWPKPDRAYNLLVRGYRKPTDWSAGTATEVDADDRLHKALVYYAVAEMYRVQEDLELSQFYRSSYDEAVRLAHADIMRSPANTPLILNGGRSARFTGPLRDGASWVT